MEPPIHKPLLLGEATRRLQGWRCDLLKGDMSKSDPKRSKVLLRCSLKLIWSWDILRLQQHFMKLPPPHEFKGCKRNHALTHVRLSRGFPTSSGRLSGLVPFPAPGLSRSMSGDWKFCTAASSSLEQLAVTKTSKGPSIKNHVRKATWNCHYQHTFQQKSEMIFKKTRPTNCWFLDLSFTKLYRSWMRSTVLWYADFFTLPDTRKWTLVTHHTSSIFDFCL